MRLSSSRRAVLVRLASPLFVLLLLLVMASSAARAQGPTPARPAAPVPQFTAAEAEAADYVGKATKRRIPYRLNLADDKQYAYVLAMLRLHGASAAQSPQLFKTLAEKHKTGTAGPPQVAMGDAAAPAAIVPINIIQSLWDDGTTAYSTLLSSVPGGTYATSMMINFKMVGSASPFAVSPTFQQSNGGTQFIQVYNAPLPSSGPAEIIASALIITSSADGPIPYSMVIEEGATAAVSVCSTSPNYGLMQQPPIACPPPGSACVNQGSIATNIVLCYDRTQPGCNYAWDDGAGGYPPYMNISISGSMKFPYPIDPSLTGQYVLNLQALDGGCFVPPGGGDGTTLSAPYFSISPSDNTVLNFCFGSTLQNVGCLTQAFNDVYLDFSVYPTLDLPGKTTNIGMGMISSNPAKNPNQPWFAQVPIITVVQGCFAPGTQITLADGTTRAIEQFKGDSTETVIADAAGRTETVTATGDGMERKPMLRITAASGESVVLTETHAVITGKGPKMARSVRVGDTLTTRKGPSRVAKIETVTAAAPQKVHNLFVGKRDDAASGKSTLFANGILVGDMHMQGELYRQSLTKNPLTQEEVLARLPKEWHRDYLNSVKNGTNRP